MRYVMGSDGVASGDTGGRLSLRLAVGLAVRVALGEGEVVGSTLTAGVGGGTVGDCPSPGVQPAASIVATTTAVLRARFTPQGYLALGRTLTSAEQSLMRGSNWSAASGTRDAAHVAPARLRHARYRGTSGG